MPVTWEAIEPLLMQAVKPSRYVGGEFNQVIRPNARVRVCLAFPDLYEIGMSYHGYRLLYERINANPAWAAERAFTPWPDFEALLRQHHVPLYSLETRRSLSEFHWVGFTLQHEVNLTNILTMIDLAGLPLESKDRTAPFPILIGGGEGAFSPEPIAPFLDALSLGDGEDAVIEITALMERAQQEGWDRQTILRHLARLPGIYVPEFYEPAYHADGTVREVTVRRELMDAPLAPPPVIHKRYFNVAVDAGSVLPVVPLMRTVHDRLSIEIRRGCVNGCRFCQAGMITRPVNERSVQQIIEIAREGIANTGYDEISLLSLSSADHTMIAPLLQRITGELTPQGISVSLPSLRINGFDVQLVDEIARVRKSGFTFAPEAGTSRLREVINKPVDQERFFEIIEDVFRRGWRTVKFYFMLGLPTETDEDLDGIVGICQRAAALGRHFHGRKAQINVTLSPFVPKSNTPFQWEPQMPREELERRYRYVRDLLRRTIGHRIDIKSADTGLAFIEAALARGDRRLAGVIRRAWELGARFDGWNEYFRLETWLRAFEELGLDPAFYANRTRGEHEVFPYEHLDANLGRRFLWADQRRARMNRSVEKCDTGRCAGCDVCNDPIHHTLAQDLPETPPPPDETPPMETPRAPVVNRAMEPVMADHASAREDEQYDPEDGEVSTPPPADGEAAAPRRKRGEAPHPMPPAVQRLRLTYRKHGALNYLSHLDFVKVVFLVFRRTNLPLAYSQGFNPQPRVQFAPPMALGMTGEREWVEVWLSEWTDAPSLAERLNAIHLEGLRFLTADDVPMGGPNLEAQIEAAQFLLEWRVPPDEAALDAIRQRFARFDAADAFPIEMRKKEKVKTLDLKQSILALALETAAQGPVVTMTISLLPGFFIKPHEALSALLEQPLAIGIDLRVARTGFVLTESRLLSRA